MMVWFGPCFILVVGGVHILASVSPWGTVPVVVVIVFIAGLLPAISPRYTTVGLALVLGVLIGFGIRLPVNLPVLSIFGGIAAGVIVIALVRLVLGLGDPSLITRKAIARVLFGADMGAIDNAWKTLRSDRPNQWMSEALSGAESYHVARLILTTRLEHLSQADALRVRSILDGADREARELVNLIEAKKETLNTAPTQHAGAEAAGELCGELHDVIASLWQSLGRVRIASLRRDSTAVTIAKLPGTSFWDTSRALFSWDSSILRHALRSAMVVLVALIIASLNWGNPLNTTFLCATIVIIQPTQLDTAANALQRIAAAIFGVGIAAGLALILPRTVLVPLALLALFIAFPFMSKNKVIYYAMLAVMTLLLGISAKSLSVSTGLLVYLFYIVIAAVIALFFFRIVPRAEPNAVKRIQKAIDTVHTLLLSVCSAFNGVDGNDHRIRDNYILAARAVQNMHATVDQLTKASQQQQDLMAQLANALEKLLADVSALDFLPIAQSALATELGAAEQLMNLENAVDSEHVIAGVWGVAKSKSKSALRQSSLVAHALVARHSAEHLLALERNANGSH
jgi:uncharacterized membrane protein YccC